MRTGGTTLGLGRIGSRGLALAEFEHLRAIR
jgi:hypothetical protein